MRRLSDHHRLLIAHGVNAAGETLTATALTVQLFGDSQSFLLIAVLLACHTVPQMVWSGRSGRAVDRTDPARIARWALSVLTGLLVVLAVLPDNRWLILAMIVVIASVYTFADAGIFALIPVVSGTEPGRRRAVQANMSAARWVGSALGALLAGWLTVRFSYRVPLAVDAVTYLVAALLVGRLIGRRPKPAAGDDDEAPVTSRLALLRQYPRIAIGIGVLCASVVFLGTAGVLMVGFVEQALHGDAALYGAVASVYMWGILGGTLVARAMARRLRPMPTLLGACGASGALLALQALLVNRAATFGLHGASGFAHGMDSLSMRSLLTEEADDAVLGQLFSVFYAAVAGAELASFVFGAGLGELLPVRWALAIGGLLAVAVVATGALLLKLAARPSIVDGQPSTMDAEQGAQGA
jgi:MFS family permease